MSTRRHHHDPKHVIETCDGDRIEVQMWYRDELPDHISVCSQLEMDAITFSLEDPDVAIEIGEAIVDLARRLPPPAHAEANP